MTTLTDEKRRFFDKLRAEDLDFTFGKLECENLHNGDRESYDKRFMEIASALIIRRRASGG